VRLGQDLLGLLDQPALLAGVRASFVR
jgi:hypothetical protein